MDTVKLKPSYKDYIWGGDKFKSWGKKSDLDIIAECWELSFHKDGPCYIDSGENRGKLLQDVASKNDLGSNVNTFPFFPVLIKLIDAKNDLSIQVHPSDEYALKNENSFGKTEMWYVLEADKGSGLFVGFKEEESRENVEKYLKEGKITDHLNFFEVKPGDCYMIEAGTIHAIGKGVTIIEIQQNSNLTYRLFDYNRVGKDGKLRELHIEKGLNVIDYKKYSVNKSNSNLLAKSKYFSSYLDDSSVKKVVADKTSFVSFTVIEGEGKVNDMDAKKGDTFFVPAGKEATLSGQFKFVKTLIESEY